MRSAEWPWRVDVARAMPRRAAVLGLAALASSLACGAAVARDRGPPRVRSIDWVVMHSTGGPTCDASGRPIWVGAGTMEDNLRVINAHPRLGIHYMIDRDGTLARSVPEAELAHHVLSHSARSISIELINDGDGRDPFPPAQIDALVALLKDIRRRLGIRREGVFRHSDLDMGVLACDRQQKRKVDPGEAYPHQAVLDRVFGVR
jgi:hypothetical protein